MTGFVCRMIDDTLYPELETVPVDLPRPEDRAEFLDRLCAAWDFGVPPRTATVEMMRPWRDVFDRFPVPHSPSYHALRTWFRWPEVPREPWFGSCIYEQLDAIEGRSDPCEGTV